MEEQEKVEIRRLLLIALMRTAHAICRQPSKERLDLLMDILETVDKEVFGFNSIDPDSD